MDGFGTPRLSLALIYLIIYFPNENNRSLHMNYLLTHIEWDTDGADPEELGLPSQLTINGDGEGIDNSSEISNLLSDKYGWAVISFACDEEVAPKL
jgi:hypothetical protein